MPRTAASIVQAYSHAQPGATSTMSLDDKVMTSIAQNDIKRPKGYTVSYHANPEVEKQHFGQNHPMKPWRLTLTNKIVFAYGMHDAMDLYLSRAATYQELVDFHSEDYVQSLQYVTPFNTSVEELIANPSNKFNFGDDCPVFDGLYQYCTLYTGASLDAARKLTSGQSQVAINWSGGLHHAKKGEASGFCYVNDIVLAILQLLLYHPRVLYIDIDVHHGDGVEQAFWSTDRVMTLSFHKYDKETFFPGTGPLDSTGPADPTRPGAFHSLNVPLHDGVEDDQYVKLFQDVVGMAVHTYRPTAVVLQCGADSLGGDRLGCFNLNIKAHGACVAFAKSLDLPLLLLGGGGYTPRNVARLWAYETSLAIGAEDISPALPAHTPFLNHFPDKTLFPALGEFRRFDNRNSRAYVESLVQGTRETLRYVEGAPSVGLRRIPRDVGELRDEMERMWKEEREAREQDGEERRRKEQGHGVNGELHPG